MIHPARFVSLGAVLDDALHRYPSETACIEADRDRENARWSYAELRERRDALADWLTSRSIGIGSRVAVIMDNQSAWTLAAAAVIHVGAVLVPLDRRLTPAEHAALLRHASPSLVVIDPPAWDSLREQALPDGLLALVPGDREVQGATSLGGLPVTAPPKPPAPRVRDDVAAIVYSSGTGGDPKGCQLTHGNYLAQYQSLMETFDWRRGDRYLSILPANHAIDFMCGFVAALCTGTTIIHQRTLRPETLRATMKRYRVTQMSVVPLILKALDRALQEKIDELDPARRRLVEGLWTVNLALTRAAPSHRVSSWLLKPFHDAFGGHLRVLFCGGAFTEAALVERFYRLGFPVAVGYGLTEACTVITVNDLRPFRGDSVGPSVPGVQLRVDRPGPDGIGEVQVRGPTVFAGYLDDPDQTAAAFTDDGWLRTGDLGWVDGAFHLHLVGRSKNLIVTPGGKNVYPEDIEAAFEPVPCEELCVFAADYIWPRTSDGHHLGDEQLVAIVRPKKDGTDAMPALLRANRQLPDFKRVSAVLMVETEFPRTASLKIRRHELAAALRSLPRDSLHPVSA